VLQAHAHELLAAAVALEQREREILAELEAGKTTVDIYGFGLP
jgi:DNA-binding CsgD family transcriptional regulator